MPVSTRDLFSTMKRNESYMVVMTNMDLKVLHRQMANVAVMSIAFRLNRAESMQEIKMCYLDLLGAHEGYPSAIGENAVTVISLLLSNPALPLIWLGDERDKDIILSVILHVLSKYVNLSEPAGSTFNYSFRDIAEGLLTKPVDREAPRALPSYMLSYLPEYISKSKRGISP